MPTNEAQTEVSGIWYAVIRADDETGLEMCQAIFRSPSLAREWASYEYQHAATVVPVILTAKVAT